MFYICLVDEPYCWVLVELELDCCKMFSGGYLAYRDWDHRIACSCSDSASLRSNTIYHYKLQKTWWIHHRNKQKKIVQYLWKISGNIMLINRLQWVYLAAAKIWSHWNYRECDLCLYHQQNWEWKPGQIHLFKLSSSVRLDPNTATLSWEMEWRDQLDVRKACRYE